MAENKVAKVLRVGVIYNGRILDEQIFRKPETIYIGDTPKSHFVIPTSSLPSRFPIFYFKSGRYELVILPNMTGKIFLKGKVVDIEEVVKKGVLKKKGNAFILPLTPDARGKVVVGSAIVLFQFIAPPPKPPKLKLPRSIRGSWTQNIDWPFTAIQGVVALMGYLFVSYLQGIPAPVATALEDVDNRFAKLIAPKIEEIKEEKVKDEKKPEKGNTAAKKEKKEEAPKKEEGAEKKKKKAPRDAATRAKEDAMRKEQMRKKVAGMGLLKLIGTAGEGSGGTIISDVLGDGGKDRDIDSALQGVKQIGYATTAGQRSRKGEAGASKTAKIKDLKVAKSKGKVGVKKRAERKVSGAAKIGAAEVDGTMNAKDIGKIVRRNRRAIRRCYEKALKTNPGLKGKIAVTFMINARGRVQMVEISDDTMKNAKVATCIKSVVRRWRFPKPEGGPASVTLPFVFSSN